MKKILLSLAVALSLVACDGGKNDKNIVKIGGILPLTGGAAQLGESARNGAVLAIEKINGDKNHKYKYEFVSEDIGLDPNKTIPIYTKLIESDKVAGMVSFNTAVGKIIKPLIARDKVIHISSAADNSIADGNFNYVNSYSISEVSNRLVDYMKLNKMKTISLATFNHVSTEALLQELTPILQSNGVKILYTQRFNPDQRDFKAEALKIKNANPDMVFMHLVEPGLTLFSKQLLQSGYKGVLSSFLMFAYAENPSLFEGQPFVDLKNGTDDFNAEYTQRFNSEPSSASINTYDSVMLITNFIEKNGMPRDLDNISDKMREIVLDYNGPRGKTLMDDHGLIYSDTVIKKIKNAKPVVTE